MEELNLLCGENLTKGRGTQKKLWKEGELQENKMFE